MLAITLMLLLGLYALLFVIVGIKTRLWKTRLIGWAVLLLPMILSVSDVPFNNYHFQKLCEEEAGFRVRVSNPAPARIIRLNTSSYTGETLLRRRPSVQAVEAQDKKYDYISKPMAFAMYERAGDGTIVSRLIDKVGKTPKWNEMHVLESASSAADYIVSSTYDYPGEGMSRLHQELRHRDGTIIATSTSLEYMWRNPLTLFIPSHVVQSCGTPMASADQDYENFLDLIAPRGR